jgi:hypothetical protein
MTDYKRGKNFYSRHLTALKWSEGKRSEANSSCQSPERSFALFYGRVTRISVGVDVLMSAGGHVRVIPADESWAAREVKSMLKDG